MMVRDAEAATVLGKLLAGKIAVFNDLNFTTGALCESFVRQDFAKIERLIAMRGELAAQADSLDARIRDLDCNSPAYIAQLPAPERDEVRALLRELQDVTRRAAELDNGCTAVASAVLESIGADISRMNRGKHNFNSYSGHGGRMKILDVKS